MTKTPRYDQLQPARIGKETSNHGMYVLRCGQAEMQNCGDEQSSYEKEDDKDRSGGGQAQQWTDENYSPEMTIKALFNAKSGVREREMIRVE